MSLSRPHKQPAPPYVVHIIEPDAHWTQLPIPKRQKWPQRDDDNNPSDPKEAGWDGDEDTKQKGNNHVIE